MTDKPAGNIGLAATICASRSGPRTSFRGKPSAIVALWNEDIGLNLVVDSNKDLANVSVS